MIRKATLDDVTTLVVLGGLFHSMTVLDGLLEYDPVSVRDLMTKSIESDDCVVLVLEEDGEVIGAICGMVVPLYWNNRLRVGQQMAWFVRPSRRRGMMALALLKAFESWALDEKGADAIFSGAKNDENAEGMDHLLTHKGYFNLESVYLKVKGA